MDEVRVYVSSDIIGRHITTDEPYYPFPGIIETRRKADVEIDGVHVVLIEVKDLVLERALQADRRPNG